MTSKAKSDAVFPQGVGQWCHDLATELWPINRSLTGPGLRQTLERLKAEVPQLTIHSVPSGSAAFDWTVPDEWTLRAAYIEDASGNRVIDIADNNLHILGYSKPVNQLMS